MLTDVVIANKSYAKYVVSDDTLLDRISTSVMKQDCPSFLMPIKIMEIDGETEIRYEYSEGLKLKYQPKQMYKKDFMAMLTSLLMPFKTCSDWFLDYHNFLLDENYILIARKSLAVKYIYLPLKEKNADDEQIERFFDNLLVSIELTDAPNYTMKLLRILRAENSNLMTLLDYVLRETVDAISAENATNYIGQQLVNNSYIQPQTQPTAATHPQNNNQGAVGNISVGFASLKDKANCINQSKEVSGKVDSVTYGSGSRPGKGNEFGKENIANDVLGALFSDDEEDEKPKKKKKEKIEKEKSAGGFFAFLGKGKQNNDGDENFVIPGGQGSATQRQTSQMSLQTSANQDSSVVQAKLAPQAINVPVFFNDDATQITEDDMTSDNNVLRLRLEDGAGYNCPKVITIDLSRGFATVGRVAKSGQSQADFNFDPSFSFISRQHFRVEKYMDQWQIIDLASANGTFVNNELLTPNIPHLLNRGDAVILSKDHRVAYRVF